MNFVFIFAILFSRLFTPTAWSMPWDACERLLTSQQKNNIYADLDQRTLQEEAISAQKRILLLRHATNFEDLTQEDYIKLVDNFIRSYNSPFDIKTWKHWIKALIDESTNAEELRSHYLELALSEKILQDVVPTRYFDINTMGPLIETVITHLQERFLKEGKLPKRNSSKQQTDSLEERTRFFSATVGRLLEEAIARPSLVKFELQYPNFIIKILSTLDDQIIEAIAPKLTISRETWIELDELLANYPTSAFEISKLRSTIKKLKNHARTNKIKSEP